MTNLQHRIRLLLALLATLALIVSCSTSNQPSIPVIVEEPIEPVTARDFLALAELSPQPLASEYRITAAEMFVQEQRLVRAAQAIETLGEASTLPQALRARLAIVQADLALASDTPREAISEWLEDTSSVRTEQLEPTLQRDFDERRVLALMATGQYASAIRSLVGTQTERSQEQIQRDHDLVWQALQQLSESEQAALAGEAGSYQLRGWVELARTLRSRELSIPAQITAVQQWQAVWNRHAASSRLPTALSRLETVWARRPTHIALLLPVQEQIGRAVQEGFLSAYYDAMESGLDVPRITLVDTSGLTQVTDLYESALRAGADLVIGPLNKDLVRQLDELPQLPVTTLALNYTDSQTRNSELFYQFGLAPEDEIRQVALMAWQRGYRNAAVVAPDSTDYARLQEAFTRSWQTLGGNVVSTSSYRGENEYSQTIRRLLAIDASEDRAARLTALLPRQAIEFTPARRDDIDFIFLMANPRQGRQIKPTLGFYFAEDIPVYALSAIYDGSTNQLVNQDLNGVIFTDSPWVLEQTPLKETTTRNLRTTQGPLQRLRALGVDSFRLYSRLEQFSAGELPSLQGATGRLSMNDSGIIIRVPHSAIFRNGIAEVLPQPDHLVLAQ